MISSTKSPVAEIMQDIVRRGLILAPVAIFISFVAGGGVAAASLALGVGAVLINFAVSAYILIWASKLPLRLLASMTVSGYFFRTALIAGLVWLVKDAVWINLVLLCLTLVVTHLGLLFWELRFVSKTVHSGLKPKVVGYEPAAGYQRRSHSGACST